jgi:hypothetical protein
MLIRRTHPHILIHLNGSGVYLTPAKLFQGIFPWSKSRQKHEPDYLILNLLSPCMTMLS